MNNSDVVNAYNRLGSIKLVAAEYGISTAKVKKILVSEGIYGNDTAKRIQQLDCAGKTPEEISSILKLSRSCVHMYLPYKRGVYGDDSPTENAKRIRRFRKRQEE